MHRKRTALALLVAGLGTTALCGCHLLFGFRDAPADADPADASASADGALADARLSDAGPSSDGPTSDGSPQDAAYSSDIAPCATTSSVQLVQSTETSSSTKTAFCPAGQYALGGGFSCREISAGLLEATLSTDVSFTASCSTPIVVDTWATCAVVPPSSVVLRSGGLSTGAAATSPACLPNERVYGGGCACAQTNGASYLTISSPAAQRWSCKCTAGNRHQATAICARCSLPTYWISSSLNFANTSGAVAIQTTQVGCNSTSEVAINGGCRILQNNGGPSTTSWLTHSSAGVLPHTWECAARVPPGATGAIEATVLCKLP
ncbi:MAG: hypothetical protein H6707_09975 [Deltaproteobacteria bacterium]|nr:hypothetical protein [Deltaproteobacteria bacterium]